MLNQVDYAIELIKLKISGRDYRAPHAPRPTQKKIKRPYIHRTPGAKKLRRKAYLEGFEKPQPLKYMHSAARRRIDPTGGAK